MHNIIILFIVYTCEVVFRSDIALASSGYISDIKLRSYIWYIRPINTYINKYIYIYIYMYII